MASIISSKDINEIFIDDEYYRKYRNQIKACLDILQSTGAEFNSFDFIVQKIRNFGLVNAVWTGFGPFLQWRNYSSFGLMQIPT